MFSKYRIIVLVVLSMTVYGTDFGSEHQLSKEHLNEHYGEQIDWSKDDSLEHRSFLYFKVADTNKDHYLDGIELFHLLIEHDTAPDFALIEKKVDDILKDFDSDINGYVDYTEFSKTQFRV